MPVAMNGPVESVPERPVYAVTPEAAPELDSSFDFRGEDQPVIDAGCPELNCPDVVCPPCRAVTCAPAKVVKCPPPKISTSTKVVVRPTTVREAVIQYRTVTATVTETSVLPPEWCDPRPAVCPPLAFNCPDPEPYDCSDCPRASTTPCPATTLAVAVTCPPQTTSGCKPCPETRRITVVRPPVVSTVTVVDSSSHMMATTCSPCMFASSVTLPSPTTEVIPSSSLSASSSAATCPPTADCRFADLNLRMGFLGFGAGGMLVLILLFACIWYWVRRCMGKRRMRRVVYRTRRLDEAGERLGLGDRLLFNPAHVERAMGARPKIRKSPVNKPQQASTSTFKPAKAESGRPTASNFDDIDVDAYASADSGSGDDGKISVDVHQTTLTNSHYTYGVPLLTPTPEASGESSLLV